MLRRIGGDIGLPYLVEHLVADIAVQQLMIIAQRIDQPRAVGIFVDAKQDFALFLWTVEDFGQNLVVAAQDAALKIALLAREVAHPSRRTGGRICAAISRVWLTSTISSSSEGMLSSRSIMVETRPKRRIAAA